MLGNLFKNLSFFLLNALGSVSPTSLRRRPYFCCIFVSHTAVIIMSGLVSQCRLSSQSQSWQCLQTFLFAHSHFGHIVPPIVTGVASEASAWPPFACMTTSLVSHAVCAAEPTGAS